MMTTWMRGRVVTMRALPSFVTSPIAPFSAMPKFAPLMPISAWRNSSRNTRRAVWIINGISLGISSLSACVKNFAHCLRSRWIAGMTIWDGVCPATESIHSPRSVSRTCRSCCWRYLFRWISSVAMDFDFTMRWTLFSRQICRRCCLRSSPSLARYT